MIADKIYKNLLLITVLVFSITWCGNSAAQQNSLTYNGWTTVKIQDEIEYQIPPTMEVQSKDYQNFLSSISEDVAKLYSSTALGLKVYAQQKGLNSLSNEALKHYVRSVVEVVKLQEPTLPKWGEDLNFNKDELKDFADVLVGRKISNLAGLAGYTLRVTKVYDPFIENINGISCIHIAYETQMNNNPIVYNDMHIFFNEYKIYKFLTMIRSTEYNMWTYEPYNVLNIVKTFRRLK